LENKTMNKKALIFAVAMICLVAVCAGMLLQSIWGEWTNCGYCSTVTDANGLTGTKTEHAYLAANFGSTKIPIDQYWAATLIRFRGYDGNSCATLEMWKTTGASGDGEFVCDVNLPPDSSAAPATMGGIYFGNVTYTNNGLATNIGKQDCDTNHRMGVLIFDRGPSDAIYIKVKTVTGTVYWDACGYY
jgi:hypothetical protein